jgi:hypothetical protein
MNKNEMILPGHVLARPAGMGFGCDAWLTGDGRQKRCKNEASHRMVVAFAHGVFTLKRCQECREELLVKASQGKCEILEYTKL